MKRYALLFAILVTSVAGVQLVGAQGGGSDVITLNDGTPGVDVIITPTPGTTGAVALELYQASVTVTDDGGNVVFQMADPRVHKIELRLAPDAGSYVLTAQRLSGTAEAYVRVASQADLTQASSTALVANTQQVLGVQQSVDLPLTGTVSSQVTEVAIPAEQTGTVSVTFPGAPVTAQLVDSSGHVVVMLRGGGFDGFSLVVDGGQYELTLLNTAPQQETVASVQVMSALPSDLESMLPALVAQAGSPATGEMVANATSCALTVDASSVNLRSGPGTGYSVLSYGFRGDEYPVGGMNSDGSWLVVADAQSGSAWMARTAGSLSGICQGLAVYDIPYREAASPQIVVQQPPTTIAAAESSSSIYQDDAYEHESGHEYEEHDD